MPQPKEQPPKRAAIRTLAKSTLAKNRRSSFKYNGLVSREQLENILEISRTTLHRWRKEGRVPKPFIATGTYVAWRRTDLEKFFGGPLPD